MRYLYYILLCVCSCVSVSEGAQGLAVKDGAGATASLPNSAPYDALTSYQFVVRMHDCTDGGRDLLGGNPFTLATDCHGVTFVSDADGSKQIGVGFPAGARDVIIRAQRIAASRELTVEVWNAANGEYRVASDSVESLWSNKPVNMGGQQLLIGGVWGRISTTIDYVRFFSKPSALGSPPSAEAGGDLGDWELDQNGKDSSKYHLDLSFVKPPHFVATPEYGPSVGFDSAASCFSSATSSPNFCVAIAGQPAALRSSANSPNSNDKLTYAWSQVNGPATATITNGNTADATATGLTKFGQYEFRLTVTDKKGRQNASTLQLGVVTVRGDNNCLVSDVPENVQYLIGPLTPWGSSCDPWPWYDIAEVANANVLMKTFSIPHTASNKANPGTISIDTKVNPPTITGSGTHFTHDCAGMSYAPKTPSCDNAFVWVWWNAEGGIANGRFVDAIKVIDDTHARFVDYYYLPPPPYTDLHYSIANPVDIQTPYAIAQNGLGGSYSWNYYDNVIAFYRLYYRTGITAYLNHARALADAWWIYALGYGYNSAPAFPRLLGIPGMMVRALDGHPERWPGIARKVGAGPIGIPPPGTTDPREAGYGTDFVSLEAALDPSLTSDPAKQAKYCAFVSSSINSFWPAVLKTGYGQNLYVINQGYPAYGWAAAPWQLAITATGFRDAYLVANTKCHDEKTAANALALVQRTVDFIYKEGTGGERVIPKANGGGRGRAGVFYMVGAEASGENPHQPCSRGWGGANPCTNGTVSGTAGSLTLNGSGTKFRSTFACNGKDFIGIVDEVVVHRVAACPSDTQLTLDARDPLTKSVAASPYQESPGDASHACAPSLSSWCWGGASPDDATGVPAIFGWYYAQTGNPQYKEWGDDLFGAAYGGPAGGPGANGRPAGPDASGQTTSPYGYISALPPCEASAPPCGGVTNPGAVPIHWGKDFGIGSGWAGAGDNYLAYRLMGPTRHERNAK